MKDNLLAALGLIFVILLIIFVFGYEVIKLMAWWRIAFGHDLG